MPAGPTLTPEPGMGLTVLSGYDELPGTVLIVTRSSFTYRYDEKRMLNGAHSGELDALTTEDTPYGRKWEGKQRWEISPPVPDGLVHHAFNESGMWVCAHGTIELGVRRAYFDFNLNWRMRKARAEQDEARRNAPPRPRRSR